jgi:trimeric autotransporter adhesin
MRTRLMRGKFTLLFMMLGLLLAVPAIAFAQDVTGSTTPVPTVQSDKEDYAPGELVTLTGGGWQAGESVNIVVNDDEGQTWNRNVNVIADASGNITDSFNLPDWFVATYSVTATGASGTATTTFTDSISFTSSSTNDNGAGSISPNALTISKPGTVAQNDVMLAQITYAIGSGVNVTAPSGWNLIRTDTSGSNPNNIGQRVYYKVAGASEPASYTWTLNNSPRKATGGISVYRGVDTTNPVVGDNGGIGTSNTPTAPSVTTTARTTQVARLFGTLANTTLSTPTNASERYERANTNAALPAGPTVAGDDARQFDVGATGTATSSAGAPAAWVAQTVALNWTQTATSDNGNSGSTSFTLAKPDDATANDVMIAQVTFLGNQSVNVTPPSDWNLISKRTNTGGPVTQAAYWKRAGTSEPSSYTWTFGSSQEAIGGMTAYDNIITTGNPVDASQTNPPNTDANLAASTNLFAIPVTTTAANDVVIGLFGIRTSANNVKMTPVLQPGLVERYDEFRGGTGDTRAVSAYDRQQPNIGSTVPITTIADNSGSYVAHTIALKSQPTDTTPPTVVIDSTLPSTLNGTGSSTITWHANENGTFSVRVGGTNCSTGTQVASGNYTTQPTTTTSTVNAADLANGSNTIRVCVTDAATNTGSATTTITNNPVQNTSVSDITATTSTYGGTTDLSAKVSPSGAPGSVDFVVNGGSPVAANYDSSTGVATLSNYAHGLDASTTAYSVKADFTSTSANYNNSDATNATALTVNKKTVTGSFSADDKIYDGTTAATGTRSLSGAISGDDVSLTGGTATFDNENVANGKTVTLSGASLSGTDAGNYVLASGPITDTANITPKQLTVSATGVNKQYDGTNSATVTLSDNRVSGDSLNTSYTSASFNNENVGTGKPVSVSGISVTGTDAGNYTFNTTASTTADITVRAITVTAVADSKTYDGTTSSNGTPTVTPSGSIASGDTANFTQSFDNKDAGTGKTLAPSGSVSDGNNGDNYDVTFANNTNGTITQAALDISAVSDTKVYDGTTSSNGTPTVGAGQLKGSDNVSNLAQEFQSKDVKGANGSTLEVTTYTVSDGNSGGNYTVSTHTANGTITKAPLDISAVSDTKVYDATTTSSGTPTVSGLKGTDTVTNKAQAFQSKNVLGTNGSTLEVTSYTVSDGNSGGNYTVSTHTANGTITKKALTITGLSAQNKVYDGNNNATISGTPQLQGVVSGDSVSLSGTASGTFNDALVGDNKPVTVTGLSLSAGGDAGNYSLTLPTNLSANITAWNAQGSGFYAPVGIANSEFVAAPGTPPAANNTDVWNTVKGGSTVPLKFNVYAGTVEKTNTSDIQGFTANKLATCSAAGAVDDTVDYFLTTGGTSLRYDTTAKQFIQNWQTPKVSNDTCYRATVKFADNSTISAFFKLKK